MHEFSIVASILEIALEAAEQNRVTGITGVEVEVGEASGVVPEAMEFAWESARKGTLLGDALLLIRTIPLRARCRDCGRELPAGSVYEICPSCGGCNPEIIAGRELRVVALRT